MELISNPNRKKKQNFGDVYRGYFVPQVITGRSEAFRRDIAEFVTGWCGRIKDGFQEFVRNSGDFGLKSFGEKFRDSFFSKILVTSPKEDQYICWQILWGVWADLFLHGVELEDNQDSQDCYNFLYKVACIYLLFYLYHCQTNEVTASVPLSPGTVEELLTIAELAQERFGVTEVADVLDYLLVRKCICISAYDGLQYLSQSRTGTPLKLPKSSNTS